MINNKLLVVMIIGSLLAIGSIGYIFKDNANDIKVPTYPTYISSIYGNVSINEPYTVILPMPLNITKNPMFTEDEIFVMEGNASLNYTKTKYGLGLRIESSGDFILKAILKARTPSQRFGYYTLSEENITKTKSYPQLDFYDEHLFWVYGNFTSPNNELEVKMGTDKETGCSNDIGVIYGTISNGWQNIDGKYMRCYA